MPATRVTRRAGSRLTLPAFEPPPRCLVNAGDRCDDLTLDVPARHTAVR